MSQVRIGRGGDRRCSVAFDAGMWRDGAAGGLTASRHLHFYSLNQVEPVFFAKLYELSEIFQPSLHLFFSALRDGWTS